MWDIISRIDCRKQAEKAMTTKGNGKGKSFVDSESLLSNENFGDTLT